MVLDLEMFARLTDEMLIDDLVRCLEFCRSPPEEVRSCEERSDELGMRQLRQ